MIAKEPTTPSRRRPADSSAATEPNQPVPVFERPASLPDLAQALDRCRECPIGALATQAVPGEGPKRARLMFVGEQPGDQEDLRGRPFVGPAGQLLDRALSRARLAARRRLRHQRGQAFQVRAARQAAYPQDAGATGSRGLPALAGERDRAGAAGSAGRARRDRGAPGQRPCRRGHAGTRHVDPAQRWAARADHAAPVGAAAHRCLRARCRLRRMAR